MYVGWGKRKQSYPSRFTENPTITKHTWHTVVAAVVGLDTVCTTARKKWVLDDKVVVDKDAPVTFEDYCIWVSDWKQGAAVRENPAATRSHIRYTHLWYRYFTYGHASAGRYWICTWSSTGNVDGWNGSTVSVAYGVIPVCIKDFLMESLAVSLV